MTRRFIWLGASLVSGTVVILALAILWLFPHSRQDQRLRFPLPDYPQPRLQQDSIADLRTFEQEQRARLQHPDAVGETAGARIPIEEAMRQIAEEKIAGWPQQQAEAATPSAPQALPESKNAAKVTAPTPAPPAAARNRSEMRRGVAKQRGRRLIPSKTRRPLASRRRAP